MLNARINKNANKAEYDLVFNSILFDEKYYATVSGVNGDRSALVSHYISSGDKNNLAPSLDFDPKFYSICNPDVASAGVNKLVHYINFGDLEGRLPTKQAAREAAKFLDGSDFFDTEFFETEFEIKFPDLRPHEQQVALWRLGYRPNAYFDDRFYKGLYPDVSGYSGCPGEHYLKIGRNQLRICNPSSYGEFHDLVSARLNKRFYFSSAPDLDPECDFAHHYISEGIFKGLEPEPGYSNDYYLRRYADILQTGSPGYLHFAKYGEPEGRIGVPDFKPGMNVGEIAFDPQKPTLVIANHEASRTGAPLVGLNVALELSSKYNIISLLGHVRDIHSAFLEYSCATYSGNPDALDGEYLLRYLRKKYGLFAIILNSVETSVFANSATWANVPVVALVHEFAEYTRPNSRLAELVRLVDTAIVPAELLFESAQKETYFYCSATAPNVEVKVQGALPWLPPSEKADQLSANDILSFFRKTAPHKTKFVLGAGHAGIRKGNDLFVQIAAEVAKIRNDVAFVWVGDGYSPMYDMGYSIWVSEMVSRMGLADTVYFFPPQPSLSEFYAISDLFLLSSRLDPFPNVVIDALSADKRVVCFEGATGCAELFRDQRVDGVAVPYCDTKAAADAIITLLDTPAELGKNAAAAKSRFDFPAYCAYLNEKVVEAAASSEKIRQSADYILSTGVFDATYYDVTPARQVIGDKALLDYIRGSSKGLARRNPMRGFSENIYYSQNAVEIGVSALESALRKSGGNTEKIQTHKSFKVGSGTISRRNEPIRALLHVHAHYAGEISEVVTRLNKAKVAIDVVATTTSDADTALVKYLLSKLKFGSGAVRQVVNCGRDVGPFLTQVSDLALDGGYEVVGHVHTKKSLAVGVAAGASWKNYLFDSLLGNSPKVLNDILGLFAEDQKLGLLFPEDGNNIGWSSNLPFAEALTQKFENGLVLPLRPMFPVGNMFWARVAAIKPLWDLGLTDDDFPSEPVPYDGSILHAIERLTPTVCERAGFDWATVYVDGIVR